MQRSFIKIMIGITLVVILSSGVASAATTRVMLDKDTWLIPVGCKVGREIMFRGGTEVVLNENGEVIEGTVRGNYWFRPPTARDSILWLSKVVLNDNGEAIGGTLSGANFEVYVDKAGTNLDFLLDTDISFYDNGMPSYGTLHSDKLLRPVGWKSMNKGKLAGFIWIKGRSEIKFTPECEVTSGTLAKDTTIGKSNYPAGTKLTFRDSGEVTVVK